MPPIPRSLARALLALALLAGAGAAGRQARADRAGPDAGAPPHPPPAAAPGSAAQALGFRMEGQPQLEIPFGDADAYRRTVDRFLALHDQMQELRDDFSRSVQEVLGRVGVEERDKDKERKPRRCPEAEIAAPYARAFALGQQYLRSGRELERNFTEVRNLDGLGETQGLTPDYRYKVKRVLELYKLLLADYREMKVAFHAQLAAEIKWKGCDPARLLARAEQAGKDLVGPLAAGGDPAPSPGPADGAVTVSFFIDNTRCKDPVRVFVDQAPLGQVEGTARVGFRAKAGPHDLCVLPQSDTRTCGAAGTVRRAYLHEGFTLTLRCGAK